MKTRTHLVTFLSLLIGLLLFVYVIRQAGSQELLARVRGIGPGFLWVLLVAGLRPLVRSLAWQQAIQPEHRSQISFFTIWRARLIGDALGALTTGGPLAAEPARLLFVRGGLGVTEAAASLSAEFLTYFISCCVFMLLGLVMLLAEFVLSPELRQASLIAVLLLIVILVLALLVFSRQFSLIAFLHAALHRFVEHHHFRGWLEAQLNRLLKLEAYLFDFYRQRSRDFLLVSGYEALFHLLGVLEIYLTLQLIGLVPDWTTAFIFEAVNRLINMVFAFVPVKVGVDEAGTALLAQALGLGSLPGVTLALYRKIRVLGWTAIGLLLLALPHKQSRMTSKEDEELERKQRAAE